MLTDLGHPAGVRPRRSLSQTLSVYVRLGNMKVYIQWLAPLIGWSMVADPFGLSATEVTALVLFMLACLTGTAAGGALDDVQGYRDGIDQQTYTKNARGGFQAKNNRSVKPIVNGEISVEDAHRFGIAIALASFVLGSVAISIAPEAPAWLIPLWAVWVFVCSQYGYGSKVSYYGGAELLLGLVIVTIVWFPVVILDGELTQTVVFQAYLIGTLLSQVTLFSMVHDKAVDAAAGRRTLAVRLSLPTYKLAVVAWFATGWVVAVTGFAVGALDGWVLLAWLPVFALQVYQLVLGLYHADPLAARQVGWHVFDVAFVTFIVANLLTS